MSDMLIVGLLIVIIFILISMAAPEIMIYLAFIMCIITLVICIIMGGMMFLADPMGCINGLIFHNPFVENFIEIQKGMMLMPNGTVGMP